MFFWDQTQTKISYLVTTNGLGGGVPVEGKLIKGIGYINTYGGFYSTDTAENNSDFVYQLSISSTPVINPYSSDCRARGNSVRPVRETN